MSGSCNGCGDCCAVVTLSPGMVRLANGAIDEGIMSPDVLWVRDDLRLLTQAEAESRRPGILPPELGGGYYECRRFDYVSRRCTAYDDRPPVCRNFPWYGREARPAGVLEGLDRCGYWADVLFFRASEDGLAVVA